MLKNICENSEKGRAGRGVRPYGEAGTGGVEPRPYGGVTRSAVNGPSGTPAPTEGYKGRGRTGGVEPRPYGGYKGCGKRAVGEIGEAPPVAEEASRFRGSAPIGGYDSGRQSVGTTVGNRRPLRVGCK